MSRFRHHFEKKCTQMAHLFASKERAQFLRTTSKFLAYFSTSIVQDKSPVILLHIKQGRDESLRDYLNRFNCEAVQVPDLCDQAAILTISAGLQPGPFAESLAKKPPLDLDDLKRRSMKYINLEEFSNAERYRY